MIRAAVPAATVEVGRDPAGMSSITLSRTGIDGEAATTLPVSTA
jgi:hypothetical protein